MELKKCTKCGEEKELSEFNSSGSINKDGSKRLRSECKSCEKEYKKEYRKYNKDKIKELKKKYMKNNKDKIKEYQKEYHKKYRENNKDKIKEYKKEYRENNKDKNKEYTKLNKDKIKKRKKEYYKNNKDKLKEYKKEYSSKLRFQELELLNKEFQSFVINNPKYYNKKAETWTYIIKSDGFYKIGITNRFTSRIKEINKCIPIYEAHRLPINIERRLHLELDDYRFCYDEQFKGYTELFNITDDIASEIIKREHFKKVKKEFDN